MQGRAPDRVERNRHFHAFEVYRDLGYGRTFREVGRIVEASTTSVSKWAKWFDWDKRIANHTAVVAEKKEVGALLKIDDPIAQRLVDAMNRIEALIDNAFVKDAEGNISPRIVIKDAEELTKLIAEYRRYLETYHKFVAEFMPAAKSKDRSVNIKELNIKLGDLSQDDRINLLKGVLHGNEQGGDNKPSGRIQDADFEQVPERGDEDGHGRNGVSGRLASGNSGDEGTVRES